MSTWRAESGYLTRYLGSGVLNTAVGFAVIFLVMWLGMPPIAANVTGYAIGFILGFIVSKKLVFRSTGRLAGESGRYLVSFALAFLANLGVVGAALYLVALDPYVAQFIGAGVYTTCMYLLSRFFVFAPSAQLQNQARANWQRRFFPWK